MSEHYDPRRSVSPALTEVRTALSRTKSALAIVESTYRDHPHHDLEEIKLALMSAIKALEPWERHGSRAGRRGRSA